MSTNNPYEVFNNPGYWCGDVGSYRADAQGVGYRDFPINDIRAQYILSKNPRSVIDLGCGGNFITQRLRKWGIDAWGIDISQYAKEHFCPEEVKDYFVVGNIADMSMFQDKQFSYAFSMGVLEHLPEEDLKKAISEIKRVCRGGIIAPCLSTELSANLPLEQRDPTHKVLRDFYWWREQFPPEFEIWEGADETWRLANQFSVLVVSTSNFPVGGVGYGGIERLAFLISQELAIRGLDVTLACPEESRLPWGVKFQSTGPSNPQDYDGSLAFSILRPEVEKFNVILDLSHSHWIGRLLPYHTRTINPVWHAPTLIQPPEPQYNVTALSQWQADAYKLLQGREARVLDIHTLDEKETDFEGFIHGFLCVGRITPRKGVLEAIKLCQELGVGLDIIGKPGEDDKYQSLVEGYCERPGVRDFRKAQIIYWGELPYATLLRFMSSAEALLYPRQEDEAHAGHKVVDSLGRGCPVVMTWSEAAEEVIKPGVDGFLAKDRGEFKRNMLEVDKLDRKLIAKRAWERWGPKAVGDRLLPLLLEVSRGARWG